MRRKTVSAGIAALLALGAVGYAAYWYGMREGMGMPQSARNDSAGPTAQSNKTDQKTGRRVLYWHDPMVPGQRFDKPGKSPFMDMQLVPVYADEAGDSGTVAINPRVAQSLGIRLAEVTKGALARSVQAVGNVAYNERELALVQARVGGFVEKLHVRAPLDRVRKGEPLVEILSPDWIAAQEEYLALRRLQTPDAEALRDAARQRMRLAGMSEAAIGVFEETGRVQTHAVFYAPIGGVVAELGVREGMTVMAGAALFRINSLASVWIHAEVPEAQAATLKPGQAVVARAAAYPGAVWKGHIQALLPQVNQTTRTVTDRVELATPEGRLVPGMFVTVDLASVTQPEALLVPSEAVIHTGTRSVVIAALGEGQFRPVEVESGAEVNGRTEIRKGLEAGQKVVVSGQFLIDSEASLKAAAARMAPAEEARSAAPLNPVHRGEGKLVAIVERELTISHGPIESLQWGPMTMGFRAPASGLPKGIVVGDSVSFDFSQTADGRFTLTRITPLRPGSDEAKRDAKRGK
ncbi:MAG: efflux RND transporter periplasmic adaptor subunit [Burkholderiales bacterium]